MLKKCAIIGEHERPILCNRTKIAISWFTNQQLVCSLYYYTFELYN